MVVQEAEVKKKNEHERKPFPVTEVMQHRLMLQSAFAAYGFLSPSGSIPVMVKRGKCLITNGYVSFRVR